MASWYDPFFDRTFETFNISNYTNSWYLYMYFYTSYGFLSVFEIDEDSLHNFNTYLLLSAILQQIYQLQITEIRLPHHQLLHVQNSSQSYMHAYISELSCVQNGSNHCGFMYKYTNIHVYHISIKNDTRIWTGKEMDILPIWSLSLSPPLSSLGWTWFSGGPGLSPQLQSQDLPPYKYKQACSEEIGFSTVQLTDRGSFIYHPTTNRLSPRHKVSQSRGLSG